MCKEVVLQLGLLVTIALTLQCKAEPASSCKATAADAKDYNTTAKPDVVTPELARLLMVVQNHKALKCAGKDIKNKNLANSWTLYNLLIGPDSIPVTSPWVEHCDPDSEGHPSKSLSDIPPPQDKELCDDIWPDIFSSSESDNANGIELRWFKEGCCAIKNAKYSQYPKSQAPKHKAKNYLKSGPGPYCTVNGKFDPAYCYYKQAEDLFERGILRSNGPRTPVLVDDKLTPQPQVDVPENVTQVLHEVLMNLFKKKGSNEHPGEFVIKSNLVLKDVQEAFHNYTGIDVNPYLGCQTSGDTEQSPCFLTRVGLCFHCSTLEQTPNGDKNYYGCCTPWANSDPKYPYYTPGKLVDCMPEESVISEDIPWNTKSGSDQDISCYSPVCSVIQYTPPEDTTQC